jgi:serine protease DegQ
LPGSPAASVGLRPLDIITAVDGAAISALPYYAATMYLHNPDIPVAVTALRGEQMLEFQVPALSVDDRDLREISIDPVESLIPELGIFGKSIDSALTAGSATRSTNGIYVFATTPGTASGLTAGDVIASLNATPVASMQELRGAIAELPDSKPAVLQIERNGLFVYIEWEVEKHKQRSERK